MQSCKTPCTPAALLFVGPCMRGTVGTQKEAFMTTGCGIDQCQTMHLALEYRQAIPMRAQSPIKNVIAVIQQMLRRDGGRNRPSGLAHTVSPLFAGQTLKHHLELGKASTQLNHRPLNKSALTVKDITRRIGDLAMY